jgi:hypothetical protein
MYGLVVSTLIPKVDSAKVRPLPESVVGWFN